MSIRPQGPVPATPGPGKLPITELAEMKVRRQPIVMVTAYDAPGGRLADEAGADLILVGDSAAMTVLGHDSTVPASMEEMLMLTRAVTRGARRPLVIADMPFGSFQVSDEAAAENAIRFVKEAGADAVKLEGAGAMLPRVRAIVDAGIPVMGHLGSDAAVRHDARRLQGAGPFGREGTPAATTTHARSRRQAASRSCSRRCPAPVAARITRDLSIPTIGIGAGPDCDGQVLVWHDLLGLYEGRTARFVKRYANIGTAIRDALSAYADDVREHRFPEEQHTYAMPDEELAIFLSQTAASASRDRAEHRRQRREERGGHDDCGNRAQPAPAVHDTDAEHEKRDATTRRRRAEHRGARAPPLPRRLHRHGTCRLRRGQGVAGARAGPRPRAARARTPTV